MNATKELNFSSLSRWQKPVDDGRTFCRKHPGSRYDPKKYSGCFVCYIKKQGLVGCDHCRFGYRKPHFDKCYWCFSQENQQPSTNGRQRES